MGFIQNKLTKLQTLLITMGQTLKGGYNGIYIFENSS